MKTYLQILVVGLALSLLVAGSTLAQDPVERPREVFSGGFTESDDGSVSLRATLGQPLVGTVSEGLVTLRQGFWHGGTAGYAVYLPLVVRR